MKLQPITKTQKLILLLLYKFRFLTVAQLQQYLNHKDPHRIKAWLNDLKDKKYISAVVDTKDVTVPFIYCLATGSRQIFKEKNYDEDFLNRIYKEKSLSKEFKNHCLFILDIYLFFRSQQEKDSMLNFCTRQDLAGFDYLPDEIDAFIEVGIKDEINRYFLELFDEYRKTAGESRYAIRKYISYSEEGNWQGNTGNAPFPSILFVLPDERRKKHIKFYGHAKLSKTFEDISLFITTKNNIQFAKKNINIWQKIS